MIDKYLDQGKLSLFPCAIFHCHWWTASRKPRLLFSHEDYASWGLSLFSVEVNPTFLFSLPVGYIFAYDMVKRRAARYVKNKYHNRSSVTDMPADLQWKPLQERRKEVRLIMLYKVINNKIALDNSQLIPLNSSSTRNTHDLAYNIPYCRTQYRQQSFFPSTIKDWNSLHPDAMSAGTVESFRTHLSHPFI